MDVPCAVVFQRRDHRAIPNRVAIDFPARRKPGVKILGRAPGLHHADLSGEVGVERAQPAIRLEAAIGHVRVGALAGGMHARIGAAGPVNGHAAGAERGESFFEVVLDGVAIRLALPSREARAVVGDREAQPHGCESSQPWSRICAATWSMIAF